MAMNKQKKFTFLSLEKPRFSKKAVMQAFNILASIGIIATLFLGFYLYVGLTGTKEVKTIKADMTHLESSSQILTILRTPYKDYTIADDLAQGNSVVFIKKIKIVFGDDVKYRILLDAKKYTGTREPITITASLNTTLPKYQGNAKTLFVEIE